MKKLALLALMLPVLVLVYACTDAGDPYIPEVAAVTGDATVTLMDMVGDWDNLHLNGALTGGSPVPMTQDGLNWSAAVTGLAPGNYGYGVFYDDGLKALQPVLENQTITVSESGEVTGDDEVTVEPAAGTGFNLVVINNNPIYENIKFKGAYTNDDWATVDRTGMSADGMYFYRHVDAGLAEGSYEWGAIEDDGSEWGIWLIVGDNPSFDVDAAGAVTGPTSYTIPAPQAEVTLSLTVDMSTYEGTPSTVGVRGSFFNWDTAPTPLNDNGDGTWSLDVSVEANTVYSFKFLAEGSVYEDVPSDCGEDDGYGGFNRTLTTGEESSSFSTPWAGCPAD